MFSFKDSKLMKIERQFVKINGQYRYDISGVDLNMNPTFMYRERYKIFKPLPEGDYTISTDSDGRASELVIHNGAGTYDITLEYQVLYDGEFNASKYETELPDVTVLKEKYNNLVETTQYLWEYIKGIGMIKDSGNFSVVFPQVADGESIAWSAEENSFIGVPVINLVEIGNQEIARIKAEMTRWIDEELKPHLELYTEQFIQNYFNTTIKPEMDDYKDAKIGQMETAQTGMLQEMESAKNAHLIAMTDKTIRDITSLGLEYPVTTKQICEALPDKRSFKVAVGKQHVTDLPASCHLSIDRENKYGVRIMATQLGGHTQWVGDFYDETFSGYKRVMNTADYEWVHLFDLDIPKGVANNSVAVPNNSDYLEYMFAFDLIRGGSKQHEIRQTLGNTRFALSKNGTSTSPSSAVFVEASIWSGRLYINTSGYSYDPYVSVFGRMKKDSSFAI